MRLEPAERGEPAGEEDDVVPPQDVKPGRGRVARDLTRGEEDAALTRLRRM